MLILPTKKVWHRNSTTADILDIFKSEQSPLEALVKMHEFSLPWLVSKIFLNQKGQPLLLEPFQCVLLKALWDYKFPMVMMSRGGGKSFEFGLYALCRAMLTPGSQIIIAGSRFRQSKIVFNYISKLYYQSPIIQEALKPFGGPKLGSDTAYIDVGRLSSIKAIPIGDGSNIRGLRSTCTIVDEFASLPEEIFETVISPFSAVTADPAERARVSRFCHRLRKLGFPTDLIDHILASQGTGNQIIIGGTASYEFNHFYKQYRMYRMIIDSKGDPAKVKQALELRSMAEEGKRSTSTPEEIERLSRSWNNYFIFKMPYYAMPEDFLDQQIIDLHKAKFSPVRFKMEYEVEFAKDSEGFIKRSWIEDATPQPPAAHKVELFGDPRFIYVMGLDPARWNDNFGCVVMKLLPTGGMIPVYCTTWNRQDAVLSIKKIRQIYNRFPIKYIAMDSGGGGDGIADLLCLKELIKNKDDVPIWRIPEQLEDKSAMAMNGPKILEMVSWSSQWIASVAHALAADVSHKRVQFVADPDLNSCFDQFAKRYPVLESISDSERTAIEQDLFGKEDNECNKIEEGVWDNLLEMINETCTIERRVTPNGVEQFDLPKLSDQPEGLDVRRRDRFSALVLAAYAARVYSGTGHKPNTSLSSAGTPLNVLMSSRHRGRARRKGGAVY